MRIGSAFALLAATAAVAACGGAREEASPAATSPPPTLERTALPELSARARALDAKAVAADSFEPDSLAELLAEAGFVTGSEREFYGRGETFDHVVARSLRFASADGAQAYLDWLEEHPDDFLGDSLVEPPLALGEAEVLFALERCDVCKKQQPTFLAAWRRGQRVAFLLAAGPGVNRGAFAGLARSLDARIVT